ncbi:MAG: hypothetical protein ABIN91_04045 [Mucilaginibacter sp.]|uniref:hypothetical protein n=1 Tax=Mucilaginibacter sp. TaxID=1882438 RepID=UPI003267A7AD
MSTLSTAAPMNWAENKKISNKKLTGIWERYTSFADTQAANRTLWFFVSLMIHGVLFLPIPAVLMYYYDAPIAVLVVTMVCFFTNFIAGMGGAGIRTIILCFVASIFLNMAMIVAMFF